MLNSTDDEEHKQQIILNIEASKPVLADLSRAGFSVDSISDLYTKRLNYRKAIPILIKWVPRIDNKDVKETIIRALSVRWAKEPHVSRLLVDEFQKADPASNLQWAIGNAISVVADLEILDDLIRLIKDKKNGKAREMLVIALGNLDISHVESFLITLLDDDELVGYSISALGKLKSKNAVHVIKRLQNHPKSWIRNEAKKALKKIEKSL